MTNVGDVLLSIRQENISLAEKGDQRGILALDPLQIDSATQHTARTEYDRNSGVLYKIH